MKKENPQSKLKAEAPKDIDQYIKEFPKEVQERLNKIRETIKKAAPDAEEKISYAMPTFTLGGNNLEFTLPLIKSI